VDVDGIDALEVVLLSIRIIPSQPLTSKVKNDAFGPRHAHFVSYLLPALVAAMPLASASPSRPNPCAVGASEHVAGKCEGSSGPGLCCCGEKGFVKQNAESKPIVPSGPIALKVGSMEMDLRLYALFWRKSWNGTGAAPVVTISLKQNSP